MAGGVRVKDVHAILNLDQAIVMDILMIRYAYRFSRGLRQWSDNDRDGQVRVDANISAVKCADGLNFHMVSILPSKALSTDISFIILRYERREVITMSSLKIANILCILRFVNNNLWITHNVIHAILPDNAMQFLISVNLICNCTEETRAIRTHFLDQEALLIH